MKFLLLSLILLLTPNLSISQEGFTFAKSESKVVIPVQIVNNLVIMPIQINNVTMQFLLDTGVEETVLFSLSDESQLELFNVEKIKLRGLGSQDAVEGLKSVGNVVQVSKLKSSNETLIVILDESFNFSASIGVEVNGIIGYKFFKDKCVEIDYRRKQVIVYENITKVKNLKKFVSTPLLFEKNKPYITVDIGLPSSAKPVKMLLDSGNSDAVWIFRTNENKINIADKSFEDYLGRGLSGEIFGSRALLNSLVINKFNFNNVVAAYPDTTAVAVMQLTDDRMGSIGAEVCSRFKIIFDYRNAQVYLKKNRKFSAPFQYNTSGIEIQHAGVRLIKEEEKKFSTENGGVKMSFGDRNESIKYKFELKPNFEIVNIRNGSPSENAGLKKGDLILAINGVASYRYKLQQINNILKSDDGKTIKLEVDRNGKIIKVAFKLTAIL